jgi:cytoskeletal protein RodZ
MNLTAMRNRRGISLHQIADDTKIGIRYLEAIEDGQFGKLPGGIYNISYIRQYAKAIDVSESALLECYLRSTSVS